MKRLLKITSLSAILLCGFAAFSPAQTVNFDDLFSPPVGVGSQHPAYTQNGFSLLRIPDPSDAATNSNHFHTIAGNGTTGMPYATAADFFSDDGTPIRYFLGPVTGTNASNYAVGGERPFNLVSLNILEVNGQFTLTSSLGATQVIDHAGIYTFGAGFADILEFRHDYTGSDDGNMIVDDITFRPTTYRTVSGTITIEGANVTPFVINVELRAPGETTALLTRLTVPDPNGAYTLTNVPDTVYDIAFLSANTLRHIAANVDTAAGDITNLNISLTPGDANGDNVVDLGDFGLLVNAYGSKQNDPTGGYDPRADFNADGVIDTGDFGLFVNSFGSAGDP